MELILGGAFQGKLTYASEKYGLSGEALCDLVTGLPDAGKKCVYHLEAFTKKAAKKGLTALEALELLMPVSRFCAVVSREIGNGIVPMAAFEREWRELHGAVLKELALRAERVTRIFCGIPEVLK